MNTRIKKKKYKQDIKGYLSKMEIKKDDIVLLKFPYGEYPFEALQQMNKIITSLVKNNVVLFIPDDISMKSMSKSELIKFAENLKRYISEDEEK